MRQNRSKGLISERASEKKSQESGISLTIAQKSDLTDFYQTWNKHSPHGRNQLTNVVTICLRV